jgi:hypothetical protein
MKILANAIKYNYHQPRNVLLVKSNHTPTMDFRIPEAIADISQDTLVRGRVEELIDAHRAAKGRTVLETFLQPTDNLAKSFMADLHQSIETEIEEHQIQGQRVAENHGAEQEDAWYYRCVPEYIQWSYSTPRGDRSKNGFLTLMDKHHTNCMENPAVTRISFPGAQIKNDMVLAEAQKCSSNRKDGCYVPLVAGTTPAARALIPQSVEKAPALQLTEKEMVHLEEQHDKLLRLLSNSFNIIPYYLEILVNWIHKSKCVDGDACASEWASKFGVVHVIHTSLQDPLMFDVWRRFCFALEAQTTTKFLWILRVSSDPALMRDVLKPTRKTPLNIIVAKSSYTPVLDFRQPQAIHDLTNETIIHGDIKMLEYFHQGAQSRPLLETFLQPTDALAKTFVLDLQNSTAIQLKVGRHAWYYRCVSKYIEWTYLNSQGEDSELGFLKIKEAKDVSCMERPGTTRISLPGSTIEIGSNTSEICSMAGGMQNGCHLPIASLTARVTIPESLKNTTVSISTKGLKEVRQKHVRLVKILKEDFSIPPMLLKQMRYKIKMMEIWEKKKEEQQRLHHH